MGVQFRFAFADEQRPRGTAFQRSDSPNFPDTSSGLRTGKIKGPDMVFFFQMFAIVTVSVLRGGGGFFGFQVSGMIEWGQNQNPPKIPRASKKKKIAGPKVNPPPLKKQKPNFRIK